jgi:uncharacterized protein (TIGR01619 family)
MGLFSKILGKTPDMENKTQLIEKHQEEWDFYLTNVDDKISSIYLDLGLRKIAPIKNQNNVMWITLRLNNPREDGLSSQEESSRLYDIEDNLVDALLKKFDITYVGRLTGDNKRDLYFYIVDYTLYDKTISDKMTQFPNYKFDYGVKDDKEWSGYFDFLYPSPRQYQSILNRRVIDQLEKGGDSLTKSREVVHWIFFKAETDKTNFLKKIQNDGFIIVDNDYDKTFGEFPYRLHIKRVDKVDQNSLDDYVLYLWNLDNECNGDYDGWETSIEKE